MASCGPVRLGVVLDEQDPSFVLLQVGGVLGGVRLDLLRRLGVGREALGHRILVGLDERAVLGVPLGSARTFGRKMSRRLVEFRQFRTSVTWDSMGFCDDGTCGWRSHRVPRGLRRGRA